MEETKTKANAKSSTSGDREIPSIDPSDHASSCSLIISPSAPVVLQQRHYIRTTPTINVSCSETTAGQDEKRTAMISADRSGHPSEATARSFPVDPQTVESTFEPGNRASSSMQVPFSASVIQPPIQFPSGSSSYASMTPPPRNMISSVTYGVSRVLHYNPYLPPDQNPNTTLATESASFNQAVEDTPKKIFSLGNQEVERSDEASQQASSSLSLEPSSSSMLPPQSQNSSSSLTSTISTISTESNVNIITLFEGKKSNLTSATNSTCSGQATVTNTTPAKNPQPVHKKNKKLTDEQLKALQEKFDHDKYCWQGRKKVIAEENNLSEMQVENWFRYNRRKSNKLGEEKTSQNPETNKDVSDETERSYRASTRSSVPETSPQVQLTLSSWWLVGSDFVIRDVTTITTFFRWLVTPDFVIRDVTTITTFFRWLVGSDFVIRDFNTSTIFVRWLVGSDFVIRDFTTITTFFRWLVGSDFVIRDFTTITTFFRWLVGSNFVIRDFTTITTFFR
ncbi:uncharacterized protein LOC143458767 [Clavelina lepadiformis]|uniref:uncharacterized protein LOC143458767 n=1 Tax=Clavelina lepadiformis TaxID=159417 RepID=UPI0040421027